MEAPQFISEPKKPFSIWRLLRRIFWSLFLVVTTFVSLSIVLVYAYEDEVKALVIKELNKHLNSEIRINPKDIDLTILKSFPDCALEFKNLTAMEATKAKEKDTLLYAQRLALAFNIKDLFHKNYTIKTIELEDSKAFLKVDKKGNPNYMVWKTDTTTISSDSLNFALEKIVFSNVTFHYKNSKQKIKVETTIQHLNFKGKFSSDNYLLQTEGKAFVNLFQIDKLKYLNNKNLKFNIALDVNKNTYTIKKSETSINATQLISHGSFVVNDSLMALDVFFNGKNLDISTTLSLLPDKFQSQINDYKSDGEFYAKGELHYKNGKPLTVSSEFGIKNATIKYKPQSTTLSNVNLVGQLDMKDNQSSLKLKDITANLNSNTFSGDVEVLNFQDPYLKLKVAANTKLEDLISFYPIDTLEQVSGTIVANAEIEGLIREMKANAYSPSIKASGDIVLTNLKAKFKQSEKEVNIPEGKLTLNDRRLNVFGLKLIKGKSDLLLVGEIPNFLGYLFDSQTPFIINANVSSEFVEVEDFLFPSQTSSSENSSVAISAKLDFNVVVNIKRLSFGKFTANDIKGSIFLKNQKLALKEFTLNATDGTIKLNVFADASTENIKVSGDCELIKLNIQKLFSELNNFGQTTLQEKHLKGFVTANVAFTATWDKKLQVDENSINASTTLSIERGELNNFEPLNSLAKYIDVNELKHIKFSNLQSAIDIKDRVITIPKTSIKSTAINLELWGKHTFDNQIDYHIQLLISELLAKRPRANKELDEELSLVENDKENRRSVFIVMTGPIDNPTIKYDKKGAKEKIKQDIQQEKQNLKQLLKEEFNLFKKDSTKTKEAEKANQTFQIKFGDDDPKKKDKPLQPKKKEEEDDF